MIFVLSIISLAFIVRQNSNSDVKYDEKATYNLDDLEEISSESPSVTIEHTKQKAINAFDEYSLDIEIPKIPSGISSQILKRLAYIVSYNIDTKNPNWVAWHLTAEHADGPYERSNDFYEDEEVEAPRATLADYRRSGWSRGHMCPAGDNKWDEVAMHESFSLINICPQDTKLNSGLWNRVETDCRTWARRYGDIYIVCGPVYLNKEHDVIGGNRVVVPEAFFKVVLCLNGTPKAFGIVVRNNSGQKKSDLYYNSVDEVERITGMDFFYNLPDDIENKVEATANIEDW